MLPGYRPNHPGYRATLVTDLTPLVTGLDRTGYRLNRILDGWQGTDIVLNSFHHAAAAVPPLELGFGLPQTGEQLVDMRNASRCDPMLLSQVQQKLCCMF